MADQDYKDLMRRRCAALVCFEYEHMRSQGKLNDPEWNDCLAQNLQDAKVDGDPEHFCWALMLAMQVGGLNVPVEEREEFALVMQRWSDIAHAHQEAA